MKRNLFRRITSIVIIISIILSCNIFVLAEDTFNYDDVKDYYPYNSWAVEIGKKYKLIFLENNRREVKRWEISNLLYNILDLKNERNVAKTFTDLDDISDDLSKRIITIASNNIISGYEDGTFRPLENVTRAEFVTMLDRSKVLGKSTNNKVSVNFNDVSNHWAKDSINKIASEGILSGKGDNCFCPEDNITPQEILVILDRLENAKLINSSDVLKAMTDTFRCKKYGDEEQYIIETIYSKFDQVQNDINYKWLFKEKYDPNNWQELATYNDLVWAIYYIKEHAIPEYDEDSDPNLYNIKKNILFVERKDVTGDLNLQDNFNMKTLLKSLTYSLCFIFDDYSYWNYSDIEWGKKERIKDIRFSNTNNMSEEEKNIVAANCIKDEYTGSFFENNGMYFPLYAPITKYMLNYTILKMQYNYDYFYFGLLSDGHKKVFDLDELDIETDLNKFPSNYYKYPYIVKGIPKEVYEKPFISEGKEVVGNPAECFLQYLQTSNYLLVKAEGYYKTILNVDYRTLDVEEFVKKLAETGVYAFEDDARKYADYVISNKIILKGKGCAIPGTIFIYDTSAYVRVKMEFEIVSADERKNLLFGDFSSLVLNDVVYNADKYDLCVDLPIAGSFYFYGDNVGYGKYKMRNYPIALGVHPGSYNNCQLP